MKRIFFLLAPLLLVVGCQHAPRQSTAPETPPESNASTARGAYVFGWGYLDTDTARPRGGTTTGTPVTLAPASPYQAEGESKFERDRHAILSLAGDYRVSFHFLETLGLSADYTNSRPYFSWATEHVHVLEDRGDFISLQHTLVMFFAGEDGESSEPMLMKHWRQDWTHEDTDLHVFQGDRTWARERHSEDSVAGAWSQAVFQVDDSPRYEVIGRWAHDGNRSRWISEIDLRPLPRRESSVRRDYGVLEGRHQIVLTPTGWVHEQDNWKRVAGPDAKPSRYLARELGVNRYERIVEPALTAAEQYWEQTGACWADVRDAWREVLERRDRFELRSNVDGQSLFEVHFAYAQALTEGVEYDPAQGARHARETVRNFVVD